MTVWMGTALVLAGMVLALLQVQWACRGPRPPTRFSEIAASLPGRFRRLSGIAVALLLLIGVDVATGDQPWSVRWPAFLALGAATAGLQALALRVLRRRAAASSAPDR